MKSELFFLLFGSGAILSSIIVISSKNPVHSIFALVSAFANVSILVLALGVEFIALLFFIIYVGAIAILFLFVIMMLNIRLAELNEVATRYIPIGILIGIAFISIIIPQASQFAEISRVSQLAAPSLGLASAFGGPVATSPSINILGQVLYSDLYPLFIVASLVLLVAMIGAIVLTLKHEVEVKRQDIFGQVSTDSESTITKLRG